MSMCGLNLHKLVRSVITTINPDQPVVVLRSAGRETDEAYTPEPVYFPAVAVFAQPQPVPDSALQFLVQERQNSVWHDFYLAGDWNALLRDAEKGGDLVYWDGAEWLVEQVLERWNPTVGWTKIRCIRQRATAAPEIGATNPPEDGNGNNPGSE
jgi:hypothetical protein